jgi:NADH:ubiquinone oxidoreductase subunit 4 (subunit M)
MPKLTIDGGENQIYSAFKFFLYRLLAILAIYLRTGSTDIVYALSLSPGDLRHPDPR